MEFIAEPLILIMDVRRALERGSSTRRGVELFIQRKLFFSFKVKTWLESRDLGQTVDLTVLNFNIQHRLILDLVEKGLQGVSIYSQILALEGELIEVCEQDIANQLAQLPFKLLIPLFCFIFPSFAVLLIGPLIAAFFA